jgi:ectoine hydroxylase-related dioxygenase (phytanoyl-CoA dioxygenase family)
LALIVCSLICVQAQSYLHTQLDRDGFVLNHNVVPPDALEELRAAIARSQQDRANVRNVLAVSPRARELLRASPVFELAAEFLGREPVLTRAILFDKRPGANWRVGWHQDVTIAVTRKLDLPGFSGWSVKEQVVHVQPPVEILERLLTLRLHIDDCMEANGPLLVLPGSHREGRLSDEQIAQWSKGQPKTCIMAAGGALLMRPLLLHRSSPATEPSHRRVLHLEFAGDRLPRGLEWNAA